MSIWLYKFGCLWDHVACIWMRSHEPKWIMLTDKAYMHVANVDWCPGLCTLWAVTSLRGIAGYLMKLIKLYLRVFTCALWLVALPKRLCCREVEGGLDYNEPNCLVSLTMWLVLVDLFVKIINKSQSSYLQLQTFFWAVIVTILLWV